MRVRIIGDTEPTIRASAEFIAPDKPERGPGLHCLPRMDKGAVFLKYAVQSECAVCMGDLHIIPAVRCGGAGIILRAAGVNSGDDPSPGGEKSISLFHPETDSKPAVQ